MLAFVSGMVYIWMEMFIHEFYPAMTLYPIRSEVMKRSVCTSSQNYRALETLSLLDLRKDVAT